MVLITTSSGTTRSTADLHVVPLLHVLVGTALAAAHHGASISSWSGIAMPTCSGRGTAHFRRPTRPERGTRLRLALTVAGLLYLHLSIGALAAGLTATIAATYLLIYTPLKPVTSLCSLVGAIPGALPPVVGWAAARTRSGSRRGSCSPSCSCGRCPIRSRSAPS